jgi:glycine betaine/proline transport system substrate-binding protein
LKKAVNAKFPETHPHAARVFKKMSFTTSQIGTMASLVDTDKMDHADAAKKWIDDYKNVWEPWTK